MTELAIRNDCRHFLERTTAGGDIMRRCRLGASTGPPFACPDGCLFFEERAVSSVGWTTGSDEPMSNTSLGLPPAAGRPRPTGRPSSKSKKKGRKGR